MGSVRSLLAWFLILLPTLGAGQTSTALDARVQAPTLGAPQRGSVAGQLANLVFGPADVSRGGFSVPAPFSAPHDRGPLLAEVFPTYSPDAGVSEWGVGWRSALAVTRSRLTGDLDYATDELTGPMGRLVLGADGNWYPLGLSQLVRVVWSGDTIVAWQQDGTRLSFGGAARTTTTRGTYAWHLTEVETVLGRRTRLAWQANASGRLFLSSVSWGGTGLDFQYRADLAYQPLSVPFKDYRSGQAQLLDQRVSKVTVLARNAASGAFEERWHYELGYQEEGFGPAFYLASVQQVYPSGAAPPPALYGYALPKDKLAAAGQTSAPAVAAVLRDFGPDALQPSRSAVLDADLDGAPDLEHAYEFRTLRQTAAGIVYDALPAAPPDVYRYCRPLASAYNVPRTLAQLLGDDTFHVVDLRTDAYQSQTYLSVCNRVGQRLGGQQIAGSWALSANVRLADLDRDRKPDLIRVQTGGYLVLPNTSSGSVFSFGAPRGGALTPAFAPDTSWIHDFNGDGIPDIIARYSTGVMVWYGKGNFQFEQVGQAFTFQTSLGALTTLSEYAFTFLDANRDGLTDVLLTRTTGNTTYLFLNRGTYFQYLPVPGFLAVDASTSRPVVADFSGSGNAEVSYTRAGQGYAVALDGPETGLMRSADDGRGTVLALEYARARAVPGQRQRQAVLSRLTVRSSGYDPVAYAYDYIDPRLHSVGLFLLGFDRVTRTDPVVTDTADFLNEDRYAGVPLATARHDLKAPAADAFTAKSYEEVLFQGVPWKRLKQEVSGFRDASGATVSEQTDYVAYASDFCPQTVNRTTAAGRLTVTKTHSRPASFGSALSCLWSNEVEQGAHADATLDFRHETNLVRNTLGQVEKVESVSGEDRWVLQTATYRPADALLDTLSSPGKGTATYAYEPGSLLLQKVTLPDGVVVEVASRHPLLDTVLTLVGRRGAVTYQQFFRFDGQERLQSRWDDLGTSSELNPAERYAYQFATAAEPAAIYSSRLVDTAVPSARDTVELMTAGGEPVVTATRIPEGWSFGELLTRSRAIAETRRYLRPALAPAVDPTGLDYATLLSGASQVGSETASSYGHASDARFTFHAGVERQVAKALGIAGGLLQLTATENGALSSRTTLDAARRVLAFDDEANAHYAYTYDALGRLRSVALPDGTKHLARYDGHGRPWRVEREGIASVELAFDAVTGQPSDRRFLSPDGVLVRRVAFAYDAVGRVTAQRHVDAVSGTTKTFTFHYDGATPAEPLAHTAPGFLTAVTGDGYVKLFEYRADGMLAKRTVTFAGWRSVETTLGYLESATPGSRVVKVYDAAGALLSSSALVYGYDAQGRLASLKLNGAGLASVSYGGNGELASATFPGGAQLTFSYDGLTRRLTGSSQSTPAWSASTTRRMGARGLVDAEGFTVGALSLSRSYTWSPQRFLSGASDAQAAYGYGFGSSGLPTTITRNGVTRAASAGTLDALGRAVQLGALSMSYGPDGQLATATRGATTWTFKHDEAGQRLLKASGETPIAAYLDEGYLDGSGLSERLQVGGRTVGLLKGGVFTPVATDLRGTVLAETTGAARIASPFGQRDLHAATAPALDYVEKGWDADLGLVRMGARDYDPENNRFTTPDPYLLEDPAQCLASPAQCNLYAYAGGDPVAQLDPTGTWALIDDAIAMGAGALIGVAAQAVGDVVQGKVSSWQEYTAAAVGGAAAGEATLYTGPVVGAAAGAAATNGMKQVLNLATGKQQGFDVKSFAVDTAVGALAGKVGSVVTEKIARVLPNNVKGKIGEAASYVYNKLQGAKTVGAQVKKALGTRSTADFVFEKDGVRYIAEAKFGTSSLTDAQRAARKALGSRFHEERWDYDWVRRVGGNLGFGGGETATHAREEKEQRATP